ncbi:MULTISPECIES: ABC transporter ATP-binding protein [Microbacterium]|uniref:NitT/TauT family transport system ATP-binding protein n=1 Tax=Microbacterium saccharophilum TaxID=1213358 RepID=A0A7Z7CV91_9MICO|nr:MULTISPECIES: ABC transporter ATP-binding protein [Microbacterium]SFI18056.1 NitT/TauT family transport system ATP-binding protein [Microbacterium saccharophilum]
MLAIDAVGVAKAYLDDAFRPIPVIKDLSFSVADGEFVSIVGPSGCGKSTMFNMIAGLLEPTAGTISVLGESVTGPSPHLGYMMQKDLLLPWRTVAENIELGLEVKGQTRRERRAVSLDYLSRFNMSEFADAMPETLSGGMRQRVALMRTLAMEPEVVLLDEPFSALDYQTRLVLEDEILSILTDLGKSAILITHDIGEAVAMSDRVLVVAKRPTYVKADIPVGLVREYGTTTQARAASEYPAVFSQIWDLLDVQMSRR